MGSVLVVETIYEEIKRRILSGYYLPGMRLIESSLTEELKVSRVTLREALRLLVADGLATQIPNSGISVKRFTRKDVIELYTVREPLEALVARLAAEVENKELSQLEEICKKSARALGQNNYTTQVHYNLNEIFHNELLRVAGNTTLITTLERLSTKVMRYQFMPFLKEKDGNNSYQDHECILEAVKAGNGELAETIMRHHIKGGLEFILSCCPADTD